MKKVLPVLAFTFLFTVNAYAAPKNFYEAWDYWKTQPSLRARALTYSVGMFMGAAAMNLTIKKVYPSINYLCIHGTVADSEIIRLLDQEILEHPETYEQFSPDIGNSEGYAIAVLRSLQKRYSCNR